MTVLIVGGDYIASLKQKITAHGYARIEHWNGRKKGFNKRALPGRTELVVIIYDYVSHSERSGQPYRYPDDFLPPLPVRDQHDFR